MIVFCLAVLNVVVVLFFAPLFEGFVRKYIRANIAHSRRGPLVGVWQPFYDLLKLFSKEDIQVGSPLQVYMPIVCFGSILVASLFLPIAGQAPLDMWGDIIVLIYTIGLAATALVITALDTGSPYSYAGATRELMLMALVELVFISSLLCGAVCARSLRLSEIILWYRSRVFSLPMILASAALFLAMLAQFGRLPFDIPEAEQEIMGGPFVEVSGPRLALLKWAMWMRQFVGASLFACVFIPWGMSGIFFFDLLITLIKIFVLFVVVTVVEVLSPRLRVDQALNFYLGVFLTSAIAIAVAYVAP
ncbi:MAG: NADH-quinone oxidoreductase subunit H [Armatimonadota bacterium]|nr:NADH-quinone oxidoreductase subunit H [Armatimonadota bacterium]MCX7776583.1 NADH-quinone oxidoreductase subunit H [Armatimonadota bacterium]MDW8026083.1 NADH-quinone oxidoreductase subunit H [Armatimonadota bacterium]